MLPSMQSSHRTSRRAARTDDLRQAACQLLRLAAICLVMVGTTACGFVEYVDAPLGSSGGSTGGTGGSTGGTGGSGGGGGSTGGGSGGGPVVPAVVAYRALWVPSPSSGVDGYELTIASSAGTRKQQIPVSTAMAAPGGRLAYYVDLETNRNHTLTLRAYNTVAMSPPSNAVVVTGSSLIAQASAASAPSAATVAPPSTLADSGVSAGSASAGADAGTTSATSGHGTAAGSVAGALASLEFDGSGSHLVGVDDAHVAAAALTLSTWVAPFADASDGRVASITDAQGQARFELAMANDTNLAVTLRDAEGFVLTTAVFERVLVRDAWQHVAVMLDPAAATPISVRVDGVRASAGTTLPGLQLPVFDGELRLGEGFAGRIGHTAVFGRVLDETELELVDVWGHELDLRDEFEAEALLHYWRLGESDGFDRDLGSSAWPVDLEPAGAGGRLVEDAPARVDGVVLD